ncbi:MAG: hypothetical protein GVY18_12490 [Bacteroidetes bacterium]|jgi:hypothetical protein|nr:hypothetical protein [Bacteroidota bacterium]
MTSLLPLFAMCLLLAACGSSAPTTASQTAQAPASTEQDAEVTRLQAVARLAPDGPVLDDYVEWTVYAVEDVDLRVDSTTGDLAISGTGTPYDTPRLDLALAPGEYVVEAEVAFQETRRRVTVAPGGTTTVDLVLDTALLVIEATPDTLGLAGRIHKPNGRTTNFATSQPPKLQALAPGQHELVVYRGAGTVRRTVDIAPSQLTVVEVDVSTGTLVGQFDVGTEEPAFDLEWTVRTWNPETRRSGETVVEEEGPGIEVRLPPGAYLVETAAGVNVRFREVIEVVAGATAHLPVELGWAQIEPTLIDAEGEPVTAGFDWWLVPGDDLDDKPWTVKRPGERFLVNLAYQPYALLAVDPDADYARLAQSDVLTLQPGESRQVTVRLD